MHLTKLLPLLVFFLFPPFLSAAQTEISAKLGKVSSTLTDAYNGSGGTIKPRTAVFTFSSSKELEKQRVGFAVSEILSHHLAKNGAFQLVERAELNRVLQELKLNLSGVTDQSEALKAGQLASAELLVLGSVEKLGKAYHVNARLVKADSGEVLATAYAELPVSVFEAEAADYVVLVPKTQTIGVYFIYGRRTTAALDAQTKTSDSCGVGCITTVTPEQTTLWAPGIGLNYTPFEKWTFDAAYLASGASGKTGTVELTDPGNWTNTYKYDQRVSMVRLLAGRNFNLSSKLSCFLAAGGTSVQFSGEGDGNYFTPTLFARTEFHPQQRFAVSLSAAYDLTTEAARGSDYASSSFKIVRLQNLYVESSVAIYF